MMNLSKKTFICLCLLIALVNATMYKPEEGVLILDEDSIEDAIAQNRFLLIEFCMILFFITYKA